MPASSGVSSRAGADEESEAHGVGSRIAFGDDLQAVFQAVTTKLHQVAPAAAVRV